VSFAASRVNAAAFLKKKYIRPPALRQKSFSRPSGCDWLKAVDAFFDFSQLTFRKWMRSEFGNEPIKFSIGEHRN
jgi:hypothetical protein